MGVLGDISKIIAGVGRKAGKVVRKVGDTGDAVVGATVSAVKKSSRKAKNALKNVSKTGKRLIKKVTPKFLQGGKRSKRSSRK